MKAMRTMIALVLVCSCGTGDDKKTKEAEETHPIVAGEILAAVSTAEAGEKQVRHMAAGSSVWSIAKPGSKIGARDRISVEANASAMIRLAEDDRLALNSGTVVRVLSSSELVLEKGDIWVDGALATRSAGIRVKTEAGEVSMKGAFAAVSYDEKTMRTSLVSGTATLRGEGGERRIVGGQEAVLEAGRVEVVHLKDPAGLVSWTEGLRDALEEKPANVIEGQPAATSGLGTMAAKRPGSSNLLPFEVLSQDVTVRIQDRVAITRIEQVFRNPTGSVVEGMYKFPVPAGARLNRYDMEIKGKMMRGEIVERQRGRVIMKTVIRQFQDMMRDPALVEWESGSTFKTRIFPIQPKEKKRIVLSYLQTLEGAGGKYHYVLPVSAAGADTAKVPAFRLDARVSSSGGTPRVTTPLYPSDTKAEGRSARVDFEAKEFRPMVDFVIEIDQPERPEATLATYGAKAEPGEDDLVQMDEGAAEKSWDYFMMSLAPMLPTPKGGDDEGSDWVLLVDTSQSRNAFDMEIQKRLVTTIVEALSNRDRVKVLAYDMDARGLGEGWEAPSRELPAQIRSFLDSFPPAGATNVADALMAAAAHAEPERATRIVMIGDGAATLGENRPGVLSKWAGQVFKDRNASITTIGIGSSVDSLLFEDIARATGGQYHAVSSGEDLLAAAVRIITSLRVPMLEDVRVSLEGIAVRDVHPEMLGNLASGEEITLAGRYKGTGELRVKLEGRLAGEPWESEHVFNVGEAKEANTFVPLVWANERIDALTLRGDEKAVKETVELSKRFSLPSRYTSFIVLENQAMYREFKVSQEGDRFEWEGDQEIEYEDVEEMEEDVLDGVGSAGILASIGGAGSVSGAAKGGAMAPKASKPAAPAMKAKKSSMAKEAMPDDIMFDGFDGGPSRSMVCKSTYHYDVSIRDLPADPSEKKAQDRAAELKAKVEAEPLLRTHRKRYVSHLMAHGQYGEALAEVEAWRKMDSANPVVMRYMGDLTRLAGDIKGALRYYSGVLDMKPEDKKTMEMLASYLESRSRWTEAHAYRVSLNLLKAKDWKAAARRAIAAARAERWEDARFAAGQMVDEAKDGQMKLAKGVKLPKDLKDAVLRIAVGEKPPLLLDAPSVIDAGKAKFAVELSWDGDVDLDLWVATKKGKVLGGAGDKGSLLPGASGSQGEVFYMSKADKGRYTVQVVCAEPDGCGAVSGKVKIRAHGSKKTIPFVIKGGQGVEVASVKVDRYMSKCSYY